MIYAINLKIMNLNPQEQAQFKVPPAKTEDICDIL
jgi:hypothetical protein